MARRTRGSKLSTLTLRVLLRGPTIGNTLVSRSIAKCFSDEIGGGQREVEVGTDQHRSIEASTHDAALAMRYRKIDGVHQLVNDDTPHRTAQLAIPTWMTQPEVSARRRSQRPEIVTEGPDDVGHEDEECLPSTPQ